MINFPKTWISYLVLNILIAVVLSSCRKKEDDNNLTITDIDRNVYHTITIGAQVWMVENLKTTRYSDGSEIPLVNTTSTWDALISTSKAYCWSEDDISNRDTYGALYTWAAAINGSTSDISKTGDIQGACPTGWHVPSDAEWTELELYLGGSSGAGIKLKEAGNDHWYYPNIPGSNESGFTGLPGGFRWYDGLFNTFTEHGYWWSSSEYSETTAYYRNLTNNYANVYRNYANKEIGFSIRCLKD
jgi:uncharacterized protein (TIGR02145 family)